MKTIKCPNPECAAEHGLFWLISGENNKSLMYRCDHATKQVSDRISGRLEQRSFTANLPAPSSTIPDEKLPEEWTESYKKKVQGELQTQLILMNK